MRNYVTLRNSNPFSFFDDFDKDMRRIFDSFGSELVLNKANFVPSCDFRDKESHYLLSFDLPGIPKDDIKIAVLEGKLHVSGERKQEEDHNGYSEKRYGRFERVLSLPKNVEEDKIEAHYENGVLTLALPKVEKAKPKEITIGDSRNGSLWSRLLKNDRKEAHIPGNDEKVA